MRLQRRAVDPRNAEEPVAIPFERHPRERRHAPVRDPVIVDIFVGQTGAPTTAQIGRNIRVHGEPSPIAEVAVGLQLLIYPVDPEGGGVAERRIQVERQVIGAEAVDAGARLHESPGGARSLLDPVDDAAAAAATEDQRVGALEDLDAFQVVQASVILGVVPHTVQEEVGGRVLTAQRDLVAIALALPHGHPGNVTEDVAETIERLVIQLGARNDVDTLRHVDQPGVGLGRGDRVHRDIAASLPRDDDGIEVRNGFLGDRYGRKQQGEGGRGKQGAHKHLFSGWEYETAYNATHSHSQDVFWRWRWSAGRSEREARDSLKGGLIAPTMDSAAPMARAPRSELFRSGVTAIRSARLTAG